MVVVEVFSHVIPYLARPNDCRCCSHDPLSLASLCHCRSTDRSRVLALRHAGLLIHHFQFVGLSEGASRGKT